MQDLIQQINNLEFLRELANQSSTRECGGCNLLEVIDCYVQNTIRKN